MGDIRVRDLSEIKVERAQTPESDSISFYPFPIHIPDPGINVKIEEWSESDEETDSKIKIEPKDEFDEKFFPFNYGEEDDKRSIKIEPFICQQCGTICDSQSDLSSHHRERHRVAPTCNPNPSIPSPIGCFECTKRFPSYKLRHHHMFIHRNVSALTCRYCNKCFVNVQTADHHSRSAHIRFGTTPMFVCRSCYKCFYQVKPYERHLYMHNSPLKCTICFRRFRHRTQFESHLIDYHCGAAAKRDPKESDSISVKSDNISEWTTAKSKVSLPMKKEEPKDEFRCEHCSDSFPCKDSLLAHTDRHMKCMKRFNCLHCRWFYFSSQRKLDRHTKNHHPGVSQLSQGDRESMDKENEGNRTHFTIKSDGNEGGNTSKKRTNSYQTLEPSLNPKFVVDEVGEVDLFGFSEQIKQFLS